jgi:hypothetical protein
MPESSAYPIEGGCDGGTVRYRMETAPLIVQYSHSRWSQRETGAPFARTQHPAPWRADTSADSAPRSAKMRANHSRTDCRWL